jgi:hypothetical protein
MFLVTDLAENYYWYTVSKNEEYGLLGCNTGESPVFQRNVWPSALESEIKPNKKPAEACSKLSESNVDFSA